MCDQAYAPTVGPSLNMRGSYADRIKLYHTMDPAYSAFTRMHPTPTNQVAVQQLNEQGLYPTGNNRADFQGGQYPAPIAVQPRAAGQAPATCPQFVHTKYDASCYGDNYGFAGRPCHACCPGKRGPSVREIVDQRSSCTGECARTGEWPACAAPTDVDAAAAINRQELKSYNAQNCLVFSRDPYAKADYAMPAACRSGACGAKTRAAGCDTCRGAPYGQGCGSATGTAYPYTYERYTTPFESQPLGGAHGMRGTSPRDSQSYSHRRFDNYTRGADGMPVPAAGLAPPTPPGADVAPPQAPVTA